MFECSCCHREFDYDIAQSGYDGSLYCPPCMDGSHREGSCPTFTCACCQKETDMSLCAVDENDSCSYCPNCMAGGCNNERLHGDPFRRCPSADPGEVTRTNHFSEGGW